jgi:DNA-binding LacI/PurR family transcriptional regulator
MNMSSPKPVTQAQIAKVTGISQAAVSAILSGSRTLAVSEDTRRAVLETAERLGYVQRKAARAEANASQNVLIVEDEPKARGTDQHWVAEAYQAFMGKIFTASGCALQRHGIGSSVFYLSNPQGLTQWLADSETQGVLWHATDADSSLLHWVASRYPLVLLNREWKAGIPFDSVSVDQEKNVLLAAEYLWNRGHRRIATFGHYEGNSFFRRRMAGYKQFVQEHGVRDYVEFQEISDALDYPALDKVREIIAVWKRLGKDAPTALITSDVFALPLLAEARKAGLNIPEDLSVIGIDNTAPCSVVDPQLTSMEESFEEMCQVAVDLLIRRKANFTAPAHTVLIAPRLVERQSVRTLSPQSTQALSR